MIFDWQTPGAIASVFAAALALYAIITASIADKRKGRLAALSSVVGLLLLIVILSSLSTSKPSTCGRLIPLLAYDDPPPATRRHYIHLKTTENLVANDLKAFRLRNIDRLLQLADDTLVRLNIHPYAQKLSPYFRDSSTVSKEVIRIARIKGYLHLREALDTNSCQYKISMYLAKDGGSTIDSLIQLTEDNLCLGATIDNMIVSDLRVKGIVTLSFDGILERMSMACSNNPHVINWKAQCQGNIQECDSVYFARGSYDLSLTSMAILSCLRNQLLRLDSIWRFRIEFHGFTDAEPIKNPPIQYIGKGMKSGSGTLLPSPNVSAAPIHGIYTNDELSFARAHSCYEYMKEGFYKQSLQVFYTGHGVNPKPGADGLKRTVTIIITRY